jgi:hypothetical protein
VKIHVQRKINWLGLAGGAATIALIVVSMFVPWWTLRVGDGFVQANASPLNTNFNFVGEAFTVPLLWALNLGAVLSLTAGGIAVLLYSVMPTKSYSKRLLDFGYRKPLYSVVFFVISLVTLTLIVKGAFGFSVPIVGSATIQVPQSMTPGLAISVLVSADFQWPFWLSIVASGLCVAARIYHRKVPVVQAPVPAQ